MKLYIGTNFKKAQKNLNRAAMSILALRLPNPYHTIRSQFTLRQTYQKNISKISQKN